MVFNLHWTHHNLHFCLTLQSFCCLGDRKASDEFTLIEKKLIDKRKKKKRFWIPKHFFPHIVTYLKLRSKSNFGNKEMVIFIYFKSYLAKNDWGHYIRKMPLCRAKESQAAVVTLSWIAWRVYMMGVYIQQRLFQYRHKNIHLFTTLGEQKNCIFFSGTYSL